MTKYAHCMLDVETLGVSDKAVVFQVGLCFFHPNIQTGEITGQYMGWYIDIQEQLNAGSCIDWSTLKWWTAEQPAGWASHLHKMKDANMSIAQFRESFDFIWGKFATSDTLLWAKGPQFDVVLLRRLLGKDPCRYSRVRDYRTIAQLFPNIEAEFNPDLHDAVADAKNQAQHLDLLLAHVH